MSDQLRDGDDAAPDVLEAFEKWAKGTYFLARRPAGDYKSLDTESAWQAWQAGWQARGDGLISET
jgi:hypothetical protein